MEQKYVIIITYYKKTQKITLLLYAKAAPTFTKGIRLYIIELTIIGIKAYSKSILKIVIA